jgi:hypothetical protein
MNPSTLARSIAYGRVAFGASMLVAPKLLLRTTADADGPMVWMCRAFGIRDVVLGAGALTASADEVDHWVTWGAIADSCDAVAALIWRRELGPALTATTLALAVPAATGGWLAGRA